MNVKSNGMGRKAENKIKKKKRIIKNIMKYKVLYIMMIPMMAVVFVNSYLPLFGITIAFKNINYRDGIWRSPWAGFQNFEFLFKSNTLWRITRNTIAYNLVFIFLGLVLAVATAIAFNELVSRKFIVKTYQTMMIMPNFLSMVVVSYIVYAFLSSRYGYVNTLLVDTLGKEAIDWYSQPKYWPAILITTRMWHNVGFGSVIYIAALAGLDQTLYEAAFADGASRWQQIKYITLPLLKPVMIVLMILSLRGIIRGDFGLFYQVTLNSALLYPVTDVVDTYVYRSLITLNDIGMASAAGFYQSFVGFILVMVTNLAIRKFDREQALF